MRDRTIGDPVVMDTLGGFELSTELLVELGFAHKMIGVDIRSVESARVTTSVLATLRRRNNPEDIYPPDTLVEWAVEHA